MFLILKGQNPKPICRECRKLHDAGRDAIHRLGRRGFEWRFGVDLEVVIARLNRQWQNEKQKAA